MPPTGLHVSNDVHNVHAIFLFEYNITIIALEEGYRIYRIFEARFNRMKELLYSLSIQFDKRQELFFMFRGIEQSPQDVMVCTNGYGAERRKLQECCRKERLKSCNRNRNDRRRK